MPSTVTTGSASGIWNLHLESDLESAISDLPSSSHLTLRQGKQCSNDSRRSLRRSGITSSLDQHLVSSRGRERDTERQGRHGIEPGLGQLEAVPLGHGPEMVGVRARSRGPSARPRSWPGPAPPGREATSSRPASRRRSAGRTAAGPSGSGRSRARRGRAAGRRPRTSGSRRSVKAAGLLTRADRHSVGMEEPRAEHQLDAPRDVHVAVRSHRVGQGREQLGARRLGVGDEGPEQPAARRARPRRAWRQAIRTTSSRPQFPVSPRIVLVPSSWSPGSKPSRFCWKSTSRQPVRARATSRTSRSV